MSGYKAFYSSKKRTILKNYRKNWGFEMSKLLLDVEIEKLWRALTDEQRAKYQKGRENHIKNMKKWDNAHKELRHAYQHKSYMRKKQQKEEENEAWKPFVFFNEDFD